jgi:hypothetical protein
VKSPGAAAKIKADSRKKLLSLPIAPGFLLIFAHGDE